MARESQKGRDPATIADDPETPVGPRGHGLQRAPKVKPHGSARLRATMGVSVDVPIETLCEHAAIAIERFAGHMR